MKTAFAVVLAVVLALVSTPSAPSTVIEHGDFVLTHNQSDGHKFCVQSSKSGSWCGYIATQGPERPEKTQTVSFIFYSDDFFTADNLGHFAVGLRAYSHFPDGDTTRLVARGRGIIFGHLAFYGKEVPGCGPTSIKNTVTFETWWNDGTQKNCVMGWNESPHQLQNGTYYRLTVSSDKDNGTYVKYVLEMDAPGKRNRSWVVVSQSSIFDFTPASGNTDGGIAISHVSSEHDWTFRIWNLREEWN